MPARVKSRGPARHGREPRKNGATAAGLVGFVDQLNEFEVVGWVHDPAFPGYPVKLSVAIDDHVIETLSADIPRPDIAAHGYKQPKAGFRVQIPERFRDGAEHRLEFRDGAGSPLALTNAATGSLQPVWAVATAIPLGNAPPPAASLVVHLDDISAAGVTGWAYNEANLLEPTTLALHIDGKPIADSRCDLPRADVKAAGHPTDLVGFRASIPAEDFDDAPHVLEFRGTLGEPANLPGGTSRCRFRLSSMAHFGRTDGLHDGAIRGWALRHERTSGRKEGGLQVLISFNGQPVAQLAAGEFRADVAEAHGADPNCGFAFVPPPDLFGGKTVEVRCRTVPAGIELDNSPCHVTFPDAGVSGKLQEILKSTEEMFVDLWTLRAELKRLLPGEEFNIHRYDAWARAYARHLAAAPAPEPLADSPSAPLVSVICPAYRPREKDFVAAVESVIAQTYRNWELIIIDDASGSAELAACMRQLAARDRRIRLVLQRKNGGISAATNAGLGLAKGKYVAFFDHDDLLAERTLEFMVAAALRSGAKLLYCDEDKVDDAGRYSEVNFKPDWNYRLVLAQNYVCHLLFVEREHLAKAGKLRSECDGAQDHDLILRLAEITPPEQIHHVSEILYHWRKTPSSTAASGGNKGYAAAAGVRAVSSHLERRGLRARVAAPGGVTRYEISWSLPHHPSVTMIIPFREHIGITRACIEAIRAVTEYPKFRILLVNNWSTSEEAFGFCGEMSETPGVGVIRVEEPFNFSRLNNVAAGKADTEYLLFMNNDVIVRQPDWLAQMMGEAMADPRVAIVGNKLLYPNGLVQHGGIVLGVGGVADHAHRGLRGDAPGYMARAACAQELSAVTAACMLCRRDVFEKVGGFDEHALAVAYNDVDLCLKVRAAGHKIVWTPASVAEHRESLSRGSDFRPEHQARFFIENGVMQTRWQSALARDPHYNSHFSRRGGIFRDLAVPTPSPGEIEPQPIAVPLQPVAAEEPDLPNGKPPFFLAKGKSPTGRNRGTSSNSLPASGPVKPTRELSLGGE